MAKDLCKDESQYPVGSMAKARLKNGELHSSAWVVFLYYTPSLVAFLFTLQNVPKSLPRLLLFFISRGFLVYLITE